MPKTPTTMLLVLTATLCLALPATGALAAKHSTGGASAPAGGAHTASTTSLSGVPASGLATWYGPGLYGRRTACGQRLTAVLVGVANRTLPCGTLVRVSYGAHSLVVPVLDRGPYGRLGAEWDLTAGAATALGVTETVRVAAHVVGSTPNTPALGVPAGAPASPVAGGAEAD